MKPEICKQCPAYNEPGPVWAEANGTELAIFGEAPGNDEVSIGSPFRGAAGGLLWAMARRVGLNRNQCFVSNVAKCITKDDAAFAYCWKHFGSKEVESLPLGTPILALGNPAKHALLPVLDGWGITVCRGTKIGNVTVALHPSFIRRTAQAENENTSSEEKQDLTPTLVYDIETALHHQAPSQVKIVEVVSARRVLTDDMQ